MTVKSSGALLLPDVHLMLRGSSGRVRELGRGDRDGYAWSYVGGESKWRGRLNWTSARKAVARERDPIVGTYDRVGKGLTTRVGTARVRVGPGAARSPEQCG